MKKILLLLLIALLPITANAAIARDGSKTGGSGATLVIGAGTNITVIVGVVHQSATTLCTVTVGGETATNIDNISWNGGSGRIATYWMIASSTGNKDVVLSGGAGCPGDGLDAIAYSGSNGIDTGVSAHGGTTGSATSLSNSVTTTVDNDWVFAEGGSLGPSCNASASNWTRQTDLGGNCSGDSNGAVTPAGSFSQTVSWAGSSGAKSMAQVSVLPLATPAPSTQICLGLYCFFQ